MPFQEPTRPPRRVRRSPGITARTLALAGAIAAGSAPGASAAPTLQADASCYVPGEVIRFTGGGYTPRGEVRLEATTRSESGSYTATARYPTSVDGAGGIDERFEAPALTDEDDLRGEAVFTAGDVARIEGNAPPEDTFATTTIQLSAFEVVLQAPRIAPRRRWTLRAYGFIGSRRLWAHYVHRGKRRARVALGAVRGPCGELTKRMRQFPQADVAPGAWDIYVSDSAALYRNRDGRISWIRIRIRVPAS